MMIKRLLLIWGSISRGCWWIKKCESVFQMWEPLSSASSSSHLWREGGWRCEYMWVSGGEIWQVPSKRNRRRWFSCGEAADEWNRAALQTAGSSSGEQVDQDEVRWGCYVDAVSSSHLLFFCSGELRWLCLFHPFIINWAVFCTHDTWNISD